MVSNRKIITVLTCFNRKDSTLKCLHLLKQSAEQAHVDLYAIVVDDGSTDGTAKAVEEAFDWVKIERGDGSLFWNRGMYQGMKSAQQIPIPADFILWINDDTHLLPDALEKLLTTYGAYSKSTGKAVMVVGATADRATGKLSYGGQVSVAKYKPFTFRKVWSATDAVECEVMNGNLVLIAQEIVARVGNLDPVFEHAMGDIDYALRTRKAGYRVNVTPGFVGYCSNNSLIGTYQDENLPLNVRWKKMLSRKGLPVRSWQQLTSKHGGFFWMVYFFWPYLNFLIKGSILSLNAIFKGFQKS